MHDTLTPPLPAVRRRRIAPTGLTVLYDAECPVCRRARSWVESQPAYLPIRFVAAGSPAAVRRFPDLDVGSTLDDVTVVTHEGAVLRGDRAWVAVLWAVRRTRPVAVRLAHGRGRRRLATARTATAAMRRYAAGQRDTNPSSRSGAWPPPFAPPTAGQGTTCVACRT